MITDATTHLDPKDHFEALAGPAISPARELRLRIHGGAHHGQELLVEGVKCTIGSAPYCALQLKSPAVRPIHCLLVRGRNGTAIRNWARGHTRLNGRNFDDALLVVGDRLSIGPIELEIVSLDTAPGNRHSSEATAGPADSAALRPAVAAAADAAGPPASGLQECDWDAQRRDWDAERESLQLRERQWTTEHLEWTRREQAWNAERATWEAEKRNWETERGTWETERTRAGDDAIAWAVARRKLTEELEATRRQLEEPPGWKGEREQLVAKIATLASLEQQLREVRAAREARQTEEKAWKDQQNNWHEQLAKHEAERVSWRNEQAAWQAERAALQARLVGAEQQARERQPRGQQATSCRQAVEAAKSASAGADPAGRVEPSLAAASAIEPLRGFQQDAEQLKQRVNELAASREMTPTMPLAQDPSARGTTSAPSKVSPTTPPGVAGVPADSRPAAVRPAARRVTPTTDPAAHRAGTPTATKTTTPAEANEDDESISQYMDRLLLRLRGEADGPAEAPKKSDAERARVVAVAARAGIPVPRPDELSGQAKPAADLGKEPEGVPFTIQPLSVEEYVPSCRAVVTNVHAMRAIANETARAAVRSHDRVRRATMKRHRQMLVAAAVVLDSLAWLWALVAFTPPAFAVALLGAVLAFSIIRRTARVRQ